MNQTSQELALLRTQPHRTDLYLSIFRPNTLMTAQVTGTYSTGDTTVYFYNVSGSYLNLYSDITVMVGTVPNSDDVARIRMRAASGTYFVAAQNGITWQTSQYLTFLDYIDPQAIYPKVIQDPNNAENVIFFKDGDIPYSNQNTIYGTFPNAGPHRALFLESGTATAYYTATGTYNVAGSALTYLWDFQGGTPTGSTAFTPGNVTYNTAGYYRTRLIITAANGAVDTTYRYVSVYDRPGRGPNTPTLKWEMQEFSGSRSEGGYVASFRVYENLGAVQPNALVVIFADSWYGGTKQGIGGNAQRNQSIIFVGYIMEDTIRFDWEKSSVEFKVGSISEVMKETEGFSISCESKPTSTTWFQLDEMTTQKAIYHYLRWHSTILKIADFQYLNDDRLFQYFDADRGSLYDAIDSFLRDGFLGSLVSDRQGKLWGEISSFGLETPFSTIPNYLTLHKQDWMNSPTIRERRNSELSLIELGGVAYYGVTTNGFSALIANAPSTAPLYYGKSDRKEGLNLNSQSQLNNISGNYLAHFNTRFPDINMSLAGAYLNLDIAPQERLYLVISQSDTVANRSLQSLPYIVESMNWSYDSRNQSFVPDIVLTQIATGTPGVTVQIPAIPPDFGFTYPNIDLPPLPPFTGNTNPVGSTTPTKALVHDTTLGFLYTTTFDTASPTWLSFNGGLSQSQYQNANRFILCPNGVCYCAFVGGATSDHSYGFFIARAPALGGTWSVLYDSSNLGVGANNWNIGGIGLNLNLSENVAFTAVNATDGTPRIYVSSGGGTFTVGAAIESAGYGFIWYVSSGLGRWLLTSYDRAKLSSMDGTSITSPVASTIGIDRPHVRAGILGKTFHMTQNSVSIYLADNNFATRTSVNTANHVDFDDSFAGPCTFDCDPGGTYMMAPWGGKGRSSDGGTTWVAIPSLPVGNWWFANAGVNTHFIAAGGSSVRYSPDFGESWHNKEGNLITLFATHINMVKYIGNN